MPLEPLRISLLAAGAILVLVAAFAGGLAPDGARAHLRWVRYALAAAGVALIIWAAAFYPRRQTSPRPVASIAPAPGAQSSQVDAVALASPQLAACPHAGAPEVPDGATASLRQMNIARAAFQSYDQATNSYVKCIDAAVDRLSGELRTKTSPAELERLRAFGRSAHNTAIDQEQAVADRLNGQIRAFKSRHPG